MTLVAVSSPRGKSGGCCLTWALFDGLSPPNAILESLGLEHPMLEGQRSHLGLFPVRITWLLIFKDPWDQCQRRPRRIQNGRFTLWEAPSGTDNTVLKGFLNLLIKIKCGCRSPQFWAEPKNSQQLRIPFLESLTMQLKRPRQSSVYLHKAKN